MTTLDIRFGFAEVFANRDQITSANVFSVRRKYLTPDTHKSAVMSKEVISDEPFNGDLPCSRDQRNPSITPTIGLQA